MKTSTQCILVAIFFGFIQSLAYLVENKGIYFSDIIIHFSFSSLQINKPSIINATINLLPIMGFQMILGVYMYKRFCSASIYYFSRCKNRFEWFLKESTILFFYALFYVFVMLTTWSIVESFWSPIVFDKASIILFSYCLLIYTLWLFIMTLLINLLAIQFNNSSYAFSLTAGIQISSMLLCLIWEKAPDSAYKYLIFNPISHLVISWHTSWVQSVDQRIHKWTINFDLNISIIFLVITSILIILFGSFIIKRKDFILLNKEADG